MININTRVIDSCIGCQVIQHDRFHDIKANTSGRCRNTFYFKLRDSVCVIISTYDSTSFTPTRIYCDGYQYRIATCLLEESNINIDRD